MTMKPNLRAVRKQSSEPSRAAIFMAAIEQDMSEWTSPVEGVTNPQGWQPFSEAHKHPTLNTDDVQRQQYRVIADVPAPWWRRVARRLKGVE